MPHAVPRVTLIGASVRAFAQSAAKAGWKIDAIDLFGDQDLRAVAETCHAVGWENYPDALYDISIDPGQPWCYTGGLENHPALLDALARQAPLWGNPGNVVRAVRDHDLLFQSLRREGFRFPVTLNDSEDADPARRWLVKNPGKSGGRHVHSWNGEALQEGEVLQERIEGRPCSSAYVANRSGTRLLGSTDQFLAREFGGNPDDFSYVGGIGPRLLHPLDAEMEHSLSRIGECLAHEFKLQGLFGVDWLRLPEGICVIEVNPRYTAGMELVEAATGLNFFDIHRSAFDSSEFFDPPFASGKSYAGSVGKLIFFAPARGQFTGHLPSRDQIWFADIPKAGMVIEAKEPVLTMLSRGSSAKEVIGTLLGIERDFFSEKSQSFIRLPGDEIAEAK